VTEAAAQEEGLSYFGIVFRQNPDTLPASRVFLRNITPWYNIEVYREHAIVQSYTRVVKSMKMIKAMIRPEKFEDVKSALDAAGFGAMTVTDVEGRGVQKGIKQQYRGAEYIVDMIPKRELEIVVADESADNVVETIKTAAYTGKIGDGQIFVIPVEDSIRVRTGERGTKGI